MQEKEGISTLTCLPGPLPDRFYFPGWQIPVSTTPQLKESIAKGWCKIKFVYNWPD